jgi:hypothetical protein
MSKQSKTERRLKLIYILWGLLFTKCFVLEYLVRKYQAPINSLTYVWGLSIIMASVATLVYGGLDKSDRHRDASRHTPSPYFAARATAAIFILWALIGNPEHSHLKLAMAALFVGVSQVSGPPHKAATYHKTVFLGWVIAIVILFLAGPSTVFLIFGAAILFLSVIPRSCVFFMNR